MEAVIKKWGNSPALRLNAAVMKTAAFEVDQRVAIQVSKGRIVIEPLTVSEYRLDDLLEAITPENCHVEVSFGAPAGRETL
jgi:antitoxin MazE